MIACSLFEKKPLILSPQQKLKYEEFKNFDHEYSGSSVAGGSTQ